MCKEDKLKEHINVQGFRLCGYSGLYLTVCSGEGGGGANVSRVHEHLNLGPLHMGRLH